MQTVITYALAIVAAALSWSALRNVLKKRPVPEAQSRPRAVLAIVMALFMVVLFAAFFGAEPTWLLSLLVLAATGFVAVAIEHWRGTWCSTEEVELADRLH